MAIEDTGFVVGSVTNAQSYVSASGFVDISRFTRLEITLIQRDNPASHIGSCFYDANQNVISAIPTGIMSPIGMVVNNIEVPAGAKYIRASIGVGEEYAEFRCIGYF